MWRVLLCINKIVVDTICGSDNDFFCDRSYQWDLFSKVFIVLKGFISQPFSVLTVNDSIACRIDTVTNSNVYFFLIFIEVYYFPIICKRNKCCSIIFDGSTIYTINGCF